MSIMNSFAQVVSKRGFQTTVGYDLSTACDAAASKTEVDSLIFQSHYDCGALLSSELVSFITSELCVPLEEIHEHAAWNCWDNQKVTLIAFRPRRGNSMLRGVVLAPGESCKCYERFVPLSRGNPYRDFFYNVSYEAIAYLSRMGARKIGMTHLSRSGHFHQDIATCNVEALTHFCDEATRPILDLFAFIGCCIQVEHLDGIHRLDAERAESRHQSITVRERHLDGEVTHIDISWPLRATTTFG